ncbi:hypothetical protein P280DRAFT_467850 [Massarina eburnea CBS 473.64]|uniref:Uncharacterized protein n=1 Tax=Massarina eburnea CBS 473.64 TaxID=1395130 RepID=A0A6A6S5G7_9PLEO|nr:hypothetical protein P280DRAFT_467850 [Massarina eburnea CBS 473.64]
MSDADFDYSRGDSSPDPLAGPVQENNPRARKTTQAKKQPLASSSPSKQNRARSVEMMSPSKSLVMNTPRGGVSPWRIKVTVQAEPESDDIEQSPTVKRVTRTQTTTIPLKDADSSPMKRRGRPRKSDTASAKVKRTGTPVKRTRANSKSRDASVGADTGAADVDTDVAPKRKRGRPRKSIPVQSSPPRVSEERIITPEPESELPQPGPADRIRARKGTPIAQGKPSFATSDEDSDAQTDMHTPSGSDEDAPEVHSYQEGSQRHGYEDEEEDEHFGPTYAPSDDEDDVLQDVSGFAFEEGITRMPDDTIAEGESFSMISVDSLPSSGGLTSPVLAPPTIRKHESLGVPAAANRQRNVKSSPGPPRAAPSAAPTRTSPAVAEPRHITPAMDDRSPSQPPRIEDAQSSVSEAETPKIGRVVKAGVALQGVLDPERATPETKPSKTVEGRFNELDDLFRGFSERSRKQLQAGLRLGEQLAQDNASNKGSPAQRSSPVKSNSATKNTNDVSGSPTRDQPRLLTPEDQDNDALPSPPTTQPVDIQYPKLDGLAGESSLLTPSPDRSEDDLNGEVGMPQVDGVTADGRPMTVTNEHGDVMRGTDITVIADEGEAAYDDVWQEEANLSQSQDGPSKPARGRLPRTRRRKNAGNVQYSDEAEEVSEPNPSTTETEKSPSPEKEYKGKQKAAVQEVESEDESSDASDDTGMFFASNLPNKRQTAARKRKSEKLDLSLLMHEGESLVPDSSPPVAARTPSANKPNPFVDPPPRFPGYLTTPAKSSPLRNEIRASSSPSSESVPQPFDESTLPLPPSSPFHTQVEGESISTTASDERQLRDEMGMADQTDSSLRNIRDEADDYSYAYEAQDRSLSEIEERTEMSRTLSKAPAISSSPVKNKQDFEESMFQPKRTYTPLFDSESSLQMSSPSKRRPRTDQSSPAKTETVRSSRIEKSSPKSSRKFIAKAPTEPEEVAQPSRSIFGRLGSVFRSNSVSQDSQSPQENRAPQDSRDPQDSRESQDSRASQDSRESQDSRTSQDNPIPQDSRTFQESQTFEENSESQDSQTSQESSSLQEAPPQSPPPSSLRNHPIAFKYDRLPRIEPWTKTHYKTLDSLFQLSTKHPLLFAPTPSSPHHAINTALLDDFLANVDLPYIGACFDAWGYRFGFEGMHGVICAVFYKLLVLEDIDEYEERTGKDIQMGEVGGKRTGEDIEREEVVRRFATVVLGEMLRRDEKRGVVVKREGRLNVTWPSRF